MSPSTPTSEEVERATRQLEAVRAEWLQRPGVTGLDVGFEGAEEGLAIRVYVERKLPRNELGEDEVFPESSGGIPVKVVEATFGPQQRATPWFSKGERDGQDGVGEDG